MISEYNGISPKRDLLLIQQLGRKLKGKSFLHVNSTKEGGGVAEILQRMIPLMKGLGIDARWEVINGDKTFYDTTKTIHNTLQGDKGTISKKAWDHYYEVNRKNAAKLDLEADAVLIHDPQPAPLIDFRKGGLWFWRCHIDVSNPNPRWVYLADEQLNQDWIVSNVFGLEVFEDGEWCEWHDEDGCDIDGNP